jgi:protoporphyrinogen oxidase
MKEYIILGAGMAGFGAAHRLHAQGVIPVVFEKHGYHGGHTASFKNNQGFIFDEGPHISFTSDKRIQELFAESVHQQYETVKCRFNNYWKGYWIKHPAHCNLYGLPPDLIVEILRDFISVSQNGDGEILNYEDWLIASYGEKFARTFPMEYTVKYHTTTASNMSTEWLGPRMYRPKLEEVLFGSLSATTPDHHYITEFRYPSQGGFVSYLNLFPRQAEFKVGHKLIEINPKIKQMRFSNGVVEPYRRLISSIPLPDLVPMILDAPKDVLEATQKLACTSCLLVNVGVNREGISENDVVRYFYDQDFSFSRLSFPHLMSPNNVPKGASSIQAEIYFSKKYRPLANSPQDYVQPVLADLRRCGLLNEDDEILYAEANLCTYANVIFDLDRASALRTVHGYLDDIGIAYCGRYGEWGYLWTDEAFKSGENAAQKELDRVIS